MSVREPLKLSIEPADDWSEGFSNVDLEATMGSEFRQSNVRWLLFVGLTLSSILFTGCEKGSLGVKTGSVQGYVFEEITKKPVPDVLIRGQHTAGPPTGGVAQLITQDVTTGADGRYFLTDLEPGAWDIRPQKPGWVFLVSSSTEETQRIREPSRR